jgi:zinc protease
MTVEAIKVWPDGIRAVTAEAVRDAASTWLDLRRAVTGHLTPPPVRSEKPS